MPSTGETARPSLQASIPMPSGMSPALSWIRRASTGGSKRFGDYVTVLDEQLEELQADFQEFFDAGDKVVTVGRFHGRGRTSNAPVELRFAIVVTFREGRIVRLDNYAEKAEALEAAGPVGARRSRRLLSLRDTARAMSQENVEIVRRAVEALTPATWDAMSTNSDPEIVWDPGCRCSSAGSQPCTGGTRGVRAVASERLGEAFSEIQAELTEIRRRLATESSSIGHLAGTRQRERRHNRIGNRLDRGRFKSGKVTQVRSISTTRKPSKPWASRSRRCRRRTWSWFAAEFKAWNAGTST